MNEREEFEKWWVDVGSKMDMYSGSYKSDAWLAWQARASLSVPEGWQPIETAPRDGQSILLWLGGRFQFVQKTGFYAGEPLLQSKEQIDAVTHWMPLPAAPKQGEK